MGTVIRCDACAFDRIPEAVIPINRNTEDKNRGGFYEPSPVFQTMTTIIFVRHAATNLQNHDEILRGLSPKGMEDRNICPKKQSMLCCRALTEGPLILLQTTRKRMDL